MGLHPAENRGYRELMLTARAGQARLERLAPRSGAAGDQVAKAAEALAQMVEEIEPPLATRGLHGKPAAQGGGSGIGLTRAALVDRFLERNQALRLAVGDVDGVVLLLAYLARVAETRGDTELAELSSSWERKLKRQASALRKAAVELGADPDSAVARLDDSAAGRIAHGVAYGFGSFGEAVDRTAAKVRGRTRD